MSRLIVAVVFVLALVWFVRTRRPAATDRSTTIAAASALRDGVLSRQLLSDLKPSVPGAVRGVVMDWNLGDGLATLAAIDDGSVSLYLNSGGGTIGAGTHPNVAHAADAFRQAGAEQRAAFHEHTTFPEPGPDSVTFYLLTDSATFSSGTIAVKDLQQSTHPLATLGNAAQALFAEVRQTK